VINRKIKYFIAVAEGLSFTQAATKYQVSQTAVSQYIASLEDRLGVRLFDRSPHSVKLTAAGRYYYRQVRGILESYEDTLGQLQVIAANYHGHVKVGIGLYEYCSMGQFFTAFLSRHPEIKADIMQYSYSELSEKLRTGALDVIIALEPCQEAFAKNELLSRTLFSSANYLVAHPEVAARYAGSDITEMVRNECLITNCEDTGPSSMLLLHNILNEEFGLVPEQIEQTNSTDAQLMMVHARHGVALVPGFVLDVQGEGLARYPLPSGRQFCYQLMMLARSTNLAARLLFQFQDPSIKESR
jgi:DNA-binding transcriptional LysR family regulator